MAISNMNMTQEEYFRRMEMEQYQRALQQQMLYQQSPPGMFQGIGQASQAVEKQAVQKQDPKHLNPKLLLTRKA